MKTRLSIKDMATIREEVFQPCTVVFECMTADGLWDMYLEWDTNQEFFDLLMAIEEKEIINFYPLDGPTEEQVARSDKFLGAIKKRWRKFINAKS